MITGFNRYCESGDNTFGLTKEIIVYASPFWTTILIQTGTCLLFPFPIGKRIFLQRCARDYRQERGPRGRRGDCPGPTRAVQGGPGLRPLPSPRSRPACATAPGRGEPPARPIKGGRGPGRARCGAGPGFCLYTAAGPHAGEPKRRGSASFPRHRASIHSSAESSRRKPDSPSSRCHGLRPVRRLPPGQEPVLQEWVLGGLGACPQTQPPPFSPLFLSLCLGSASWGREAEFPELLPRKRPGCWRSGKVSESVSGDFWMSWRQRVFFA